MIILKFIVDKGYSNIITKNRLKFKLISNYYYYILIYNNHTNTIVVEPKNGLLNNKNNNYMKPKVQDSAIACCVRWQGTNKGYLKTIFLFGLGRGFN